MKKLTIQESKELYQRLKQADEKNALQHILRSCSSYISLFSFLGILQKLQSGQTIELTESFHYLLEDGLKEWERTESLPEDNITVTVKGFNTINEASEFCNWYSGQGEQDASIWFECRQQEGKIPSSSMLEKSTNKIDKNTFEMILKMYK